MIYDKLTPLEYLEFVAGLWAIDPATSSRTAQELLISLGLPRQALRHRMEKRLHRFHNQFPGTGGV